MQGFNMGRYVPPDQEGKTSGNSIHKKKPPGFHGNKQTVRFEMPFNVFCLHCDGHIAQGVRFNAEKKKVGNYYSTPIFSFRMKHTVCSGWLEIQTDPKNTAYVVTEGAKKKAADEQRDDNIIQIRAAADGDIDPFARKEKEATDKSLAKQGAALVENLQAVSARRWEDPYVHSRKLRKAFREERGVLQAKALKTEEIRDRAGLAIELLDESTEDGERAKLVEYNSDDSIGMQHAHSRPLFSHPSSVSFTSEKGKQSKDHLRQSLQRNTRTNTDPFIHLKRTHLTGQKLLGKRKIEEALRDTFATNPVKGDFRDDSGTSLGKGHNRLGEKTSLGLESYDSE